MAVFNCFLDLKNSYCEAKKAVLYSARKWISNWNRERSQRHESDGTDYRR